LESLLSSLITSGDLFIALDGSAILRWFCLIVGSDHQFITDEKAPKEQALEVAKRGNGKERGQRLCFEG
jgi:hypothetical protein